MTARDDMTARKKRRSWALPDPAAHEYDAMLQEVERDICLLYHQLAEDYSPAGACLDYEVFDLPYWKYLDLGVQTGDERREFIRVGCLVMLAAMAYDVFEDHGFPLIGDEDRYKSAKFAMRSQYAQGDDTDDLVDAVNRSFELIDARPDGDYDESEIAEMDAQWAWIHRRFVRRYFEGVADSFATESFFQRFRRRWLSRTDHEPSMY